MSGWRFARIAGSCAVDFSLGTIKAGREPKAVVQLGAAAHAFASVDVAMQLNSGLCKRPELAGRP